MTEVFGAVYADLYDAIYRDKDYAGECALIERVLEQHGQPPMRRLLDLGCGTGRHAEFLLEHGFEVVGVDRSREMLMRAQARVPKLKVVCSDIRNAIAGTPQSFDAALMMFAVLSYLPENRDVAAALQTVRSHVRKGGLFLFDAWFGPAVLTQRPETRTRLVEDGRGRVIRRTAKADLDLLEQRCNVTLETAELKNGQTENTNRETHTMRFFFPRELELLLEAQELQLLHLSKFPQVEEVPDTTSWSIMGIARVV